MPRKPPRSDRKEFFWRRALERYRQSGLSQAEFCKREQLNANTFSSWKKIIADRDLEAAAEQGAKADLPFVSVAIPAEVAAVNATQDSVAVAEIDLTRRTVRIYNGATAETLKAILAAVREVK